MPVREAVAASAVLMSISAQAASTPAATGRHGWRVPGSAACRRPTIQARAQAPMPSSEACWLRWRRLPSASPGVEG